MPKINVLSRDISELIAAGEVVERPASVIKEMLENSVDAGAKSITIEIKNGGIKYMRITDDGCGISYDDVPLAFLRHATSKITVEEDLNSISTLGFRGEALAAISSVARVEMLTKTQDQENGTRFVIEGSEQLEYDEAGCEYGTTIIVRDIFFNTPARMKFLKKDSSEANAVAAVVDRIALSHPEISFKFIRDGKQELVTSGDGRLESVVYMVLGRDFSKSLISVNYTFERISVTGLVCKPISCKATRNNQFTFLNSRLIKSGTVTAAAEQAYKNSSMIGKFPGFVLNINVPYDTVDVNVHPSKTEVRFSDEHRIFNAVFGAVKNALAVGDTRPQISMHTPVQNKFVNMTTQEYRQQTITEPQTIAEKIYFKEANDKKDEIIHNRLNDNKGSVIYGMDLPAQVKTDNPVCYVKTKDVTINVDEPSKDDNDIYLQNEETEVKLIGEAFSTYIVVEKGKSIYIIDKHAAHERILFNKLKKEQQPQMQALLSPKRVILEKHNYDAVISNIDLITKAGFEVEDFGNGCVIVRAVPVTLVNESIEALITEIAESLLSVSQVQVEREENLFHTVACKAAIKAGSNTSSLEMEKLAQKVLSDKEIMYCPHGRPVAFEVKKNELEKQFGRIQ